MNTANMVTKLMYGAARNSIRSASAGMRSSLQNSLMPSATGCSQPNRPPTRVGPSRSWIRAETFRSIQVKTATETMTKANSKPHSTRPTTE